MKRKCLILRHPLTIPRVARLLDSIVETDEFDIVEIVRHLLDGIARNIIDVDKNHPFEPLAHYSKLISDEIDSFHMAIDEDYDPDDDFAYSALADSISVGMNMAHCIYFEMILPSIECYEFTPEYKYSYTIRSHLNEPIEEAMDDDYVMIQIASERNVWRWERIGRGAKIFTPTGDEIHIT